MAAKISGWYGQASCKDADSKIFMSHIPKTILVAKAICEDCPVKVPCKKAYARVDCVAAGKTLYERLMESRKRVDGNN